MRVVIRVSPRPARPQPIRRRNLLRRRHRRADPLSGRLAATGRGPSGPLSRTEAGDHGVVAEDHNDVSPLSKPSEKISPGSSPPPRKPTGGPEPGV